MFNQEYNIRASCFYITVSGYIADDEQAASEGSMDEEDSESEGQDEVQVAGANDALIMGGGAGGRETF